MSTTAAVFTFVFSIVFIFAVVAVIDRNTGVFEYVRYDWVSALPYRLSSMPFRGASRPAYTLFCLAYYGTKSLFILLFYSAFRICKFLLWDIWNMLFRIDRRNWYQNLYEVFHPADEWDEDDEDERDYDAEWFCSVMGDWPDIL